MILERSCFPLPSLGRLRPIGNLDPSYCTMKPLTLPPIIPRSPLALAVLWAFTLGHASHLAAQAVSTPPTSQGSAIITLDPFEVLTDKGTRGYGSTNALGGTRINTAVADTPQAVISLNQEFLKDVNPTNFADALRFVSGISKTEGDYSGLVSIRGIQTNAIGLRDGIGDSLSGAHGNTLPDPIEAGRLEVVKGPAGVLYGSHGFGGVINRVSKRPLDERFTEVGAEYTTFNNSNGYYRAFLDSTGPVDDERKVLYRFMAAHQDGTNHFHGRYMKRTLIGMVEWRPTASTTLWLRGRHSKDGIFQQQNMWTDNQRNMPFNDLPRNAYVGNYYQNDAVDFSRVNSIELGATHGFRLFDQAWNTRLLYRNNEGRDQRRTYIATGSLFYKDGMPLRLPNNAIMTTLNASWEQGRAAGYDDIRENILRRDTRDGDTNGDSLNFDLTGTLELGPTKHTLLMYAGRSEGETAQHRFRENWIAEKPSVFTKTKIPPASVLDGNPKTLANEWTTTNSYRHNFAIQDNLSVLEGRMIFVGGVRYDSGYTRVFDNRLDIRLPAEKTNNWTPTYGVVGKPLAGTSLFYLHSETFQPQGGLNQSGERLKPLAGENDEIGVKLDLMENRFIVTASYFNMEQQNALLKIIHPDGTFDFQQAPSTVSKGWEIDIAAQPIDNLTLLVAYQWIDAKTQNGLSVRNVPQGGTYKAVARYGFDHGRLQGLNFGATYEHINDSRAGDVANNFTLPGFDLLGLFATYQWKDWRVQVNVENVTDEWYVAGSVAQQFMRSGAPRHAKFSLSRTF